MADFNPYQAPSAHIEDVIDTEDSELAERGTRLGAVILDSLIFIGGIPFVGFIFTIVDPLFIFQESRRCVHDLIADTLVIKV